MWNTVRKPRWGALYALFGLLVGLIGLVEVTVAPGPARRVLEMVITLMMFGVMALWSFVNRVAIASVKTPPVPPIRLAPYVTPGSGRPAAAPILRPDNELVAELKARLSVETRRAIGVDLLIDAHDGVLWLSGPVENAGCKSAIEALARSIPGCRGVRSYLFERSEPGTSILSGPSGRRR
jgi:hypothetical protein